MPDWKRIVREQLQDLDLPGDVREDVIAELCAHFEDAADSAPYQSVQKMLAEVRTRDLSRAIQRTKQQGGSMNGRIRRLCLSVALTWLVASLSVMVLQRTDVLRPSLILFYLPWLATLPLVGAAVAYLTQRADPMNDRIRRLWLSVTVTWVGTNLSFTVLHTSHSDLILRRPIPVRFCLPWLAALILVGAAGAYLAQRADAPRKTRLLVATSPALLLGILMLLLLPWRMAVDGYPWALTFFAMDAETWAVVPGLALLLGALPFLWQRSATSFPLSEHYAIAPMSSTALPE